MSNKNKVELSESDLEEISGGNWVLPDYMKDMSRTEIGAVMRDPDFVGSPEWQEIIDLNTDQLEKRADRRASRRADLGRK